MTAPLKKLPNFRIKSGSAPFSVEFVLDTMSGAETKVNGSIQNPYEPVVLDAHSQSTIKWGNELLYVRLVSKVFAPSVTKDTGNLIFKGAFVPTLAMILMMSVVPSSTTIKASKDEERIVVAQIELKELKLPPVIQAAFQPTPEPAPTEKIVDEESGSPSKSGGMAAGGKSRKLAQADRPKLSEAPTQKVQNPGRAVVTPGEVRNVNQIGLLGFLTKNESPRPGVKAEAIIDQVNQMKILSNDAAERGVVVKQLPAGPSGNKLSGGPGELGMGSAGLQSATNENAARMGNSVTGLGGMAKSGAFGDGNGGSLNVGGGNGSGGSGYGSGSGNGRGNGFGTGTGGNGNGKGMGDGNGEGMEASGGLDKETVRRVIAGYRGKIRICYDRSLADNPKLGGRVVYEWTISPFGPVEKTAMTRSTASSNTLEQCVQSVIELMMFPKAPNGSSTKVTYPFEFLAKN